MLDYFWRVVMIDSTNEAITVAMFLLETDARKWTAEENKEDDLVNYSVYAPKRSIA